MNPNPNTQPSNTPVHDNPEAPEAVATVAPPTDLPSPPSGWTKQKGGVRRGGLRPKAVQVAVAPLLAKELTANADVYVEDFGKKAPDPKQVASAFQLAGQWSGVVREIDRFRGFASEQAAYSWKEALEFGRTLESGFAFAASRDAAVKERFPSLAKLMASFSTGKKARSKKPKGAPKAPSAQQSGGEAPAATTTKVVEGTPVAKPTA